MQQILPNPQKYPALTKLSFESGISLASCSLTTYFQNEVSIFREATAFPTLRGRKTYAR